MLKVKTYLSKSTIPGIGIGLFAGEQIEEGTVIWEYTQGLDFRVTDNQFKTLDELSQEFLSKYGYFDEVERCYVMCVDNARFFNHSDDPNTLDESGPRSLYLCGRTIAKQTIKKDEEMFCNYYDFDSEAAKKLSKPVDS